MQEFSAVFTLSPGWQIPWNAGFSLRVLFFSLHLRTELIERRGGGRPAANAAHQLYILNVFVLDTNTSSCTK